MVLAPTKTRRVEPSRIRRRAHAELRTDYVIYAARYDSTLRADVLGTQNGAWVASLGHRFERSFFFFLSSLWRQLVN